MKNLTHLPQKGQSLIKAVIRRLRGKSGNSKSFAALYADRTWNEIFADNTPVSIYDRSLQWINIPDKKFIDYVIHRKPLSFDGVPANKEQFKKDPTFMITQMHRLWLTAQVIQKYLKRSDVVLDLGAFPFSLDIILREYLKFNGEISATVNLPLADQWKVELDKRNIGVSYVNLDPYVASGDDTIKVQDRLKFKDKSIDFVIFSHVIEHLYHPLTIFKEAYRVLGDGGRFLVSSDNAFMLNTLLNICHLNDFLHEPVQGTAAMSFNFWRGHNRFFSEKDAIDMLRSVGFKIAERNFYEVYYNSFNNDFFRNPTISIPKWRADILTELPAYRNEIIIVAEK